VASVALQTLRAAPVPALPVCIEHGDFTPWNIRSNGASGLFVLDWEHARSKGVPWLDALHFCCQMEVLVRRRQPQQVWSSLQAVFANPAAARYAALLGLATDRLQALSVIYMLRRMLNFGGESNESISREQEMNRSILSLALDSIHLPR